MYQCWDLSVSNSHELIKFKGSTGRKRACTKRNSFGVGGQQPARDHSCVGSSLMRVCETAETERCYSSTPAWPATGTTHALHTLPCFSGQLCESTVSAMDADLLCSSEEMGLWHDLTWAERVPTREDSSRLFVMDLKSFQRPDKGLGSILSSSVSELEAELPDQLHLGFW